MHLTRENIAGYLLTLQLVEAGYHITYDEILEMYSAKEFLENWRFYEEYTMTYDQNISWFKKASKILQDTFHWHPRQCDKQAGWIDLVSGLKIEG
jgi:hypothetical protein